MADMNDLSFAKRIVEFERDSTRAECLRLANLVREYAGRIERQIDRTKEAADVASVVNELENLMRNVNLSTLLRRSVNWAVAEQRVVDLERIEGVQ